MVRKICKCALESHANSFPESERLGKSGGDRHRAWSDQASNSTASNRTSRNWIKSTEVEVFARSWIRQVPITDAVGPLECSAIYQVQVSGIVARARHRGQIWTGLPHTDCAEGPAAKECLRKRAHVIEETPTIAHRKVINRGAQHAMATDSSDITTVAGDIEAVGDWSPINHFWRKRCWNVSANVSQTLRPHVTGL